LASRGDDLLQEKILSNLSQLLYSQTSALSDVGQVAEQILQHFHVSNILMMQGDLGSGKTTLSKEVLKRLGVSADVTSPTFNLVNEYKDDKGQVFYHFDLYRIKHPGELDEIGFFEYLDSGRPCLIEWPEIAEPLIQEKALKLKITHQDQQRSYELWTVND
jgi:tRNA threonylcarbamoyladenosine biosynthesis protein TsaE